MVAAADCNKMPFELANGGVLGDVIAVGATWHDDLKSTLDRSLCARDPSPLSGLDSRD